jgi:hypothetical protein
MLSIKIPEVNWPRNHYPGFGLKTLHRKIEISNMVEVSISYNNRTANVGAF